MRLVTAQPTACAGLPSRGNHVAWPNKGQIINRSGAGGKKGQKVWQSAGGVRTRAYKLPLRRALGQLLHRDVNQVGYPIGMLDGRCDVTHIRYLSAPVALDVATL